MLDAEAAGAWAEGGASRWWLHHSLYALDAALRTLVAALDRAVAFGRWRADDVRSILATNGHAPRPTAAGKASQQRIVAAHVVGKFTRSIAKGGRYDFRKIWKGHGLPSWVRPVVPPGDAEWTT